nr:hypothetical protein [Chroococcidiopsis cubana]
MKLLPWTLPEVKRLLWRLVFSTSFSLLGVWHWSIWRRRKQERARQCHYRRYAQRTRPSQHLTIATQPKSTSYPSNLSDQQWAAAQRVIPVPKRWSSLHNRSASSPQCPLLHASQPLFLADATSPLSLLADCVFLPVSLATAGSMGDHL